MREDRPRFWEPVTASAFAGASIGLGLLVLAVLVARQGFVPILDHANLAFHEAGHVFFGLLGPAAGLYGGTLGQLFFPAVAAVIFTTRRQAASVAVAGAWFFENWFNIARYAADARARELPLVGGGEHDWFNILSRWGALHADLRVALAFRIVGWSGIILLWAWLGWRFWRDRPRARGPWAQPGQGSL